MNKTGELDTAHLTELSDFLKALAGETRQQILTLFACSPEERTVNQIAEELGIGQSTASENLTGAAADGGAHGAAIGEDRLLSTRPGAALFLVDQLRAYLTTCCPAGPE
jgi:DNA-binding transcriptional ArsR family regulator